MLLEQGGQSGLQQGRSQRRLQQQGLIPVVRLRLLLLEEPVLDRGQWHLSADQSLLGEQGSRLLDALRLCRELGDGGVLEELAWGQREPLLPRAGDDLQTQDRVASQSEEVLLYA